MENMMRVDFNATIVDHEAAREACRLMVNAICDMATVHVDEQVQAAIDKAHEALGLPGDFAIRSLINELNTDKEPHYD